MNQTNMNHPLPSSESDLVDVVLLMRPPTEWWPLGVVGYPGDHNGVRASQSGQLPNSSLVAREFHAFTTLLNRKSIPHMVIDFPSELDVRNHPPKGAYDAVFLRDCAVIAPSGTAYVPVRFRDSRRQREARIIWEWLDLLGLERLCQVGDLPGSIEGGDTITGILPNGESYLLTGAQRNDTLGSAFLREILHIPERNHVTILTELCHIDSLLCAINRSMASGSVLQSIIVCPNLIRAGLPELIRALSDGGVQGLIFANTMDTSAENGTLAINGITVGAPSGDYLITGARFREQARIELEIRQFGFGHISSPLSQYLQFSSGGVRCSTQVVRLEREAVRRTDPFKVPSTSA